MPEIVVRLSIVLLVGVVVWLSVTFGKRFVDVRRQRALSASLPDTLSSVINTDNTTNKAHVRILAFSTLDCQQCHRLQAPALQRVLEARGNSVAIVDIDATTSPEVAQRYQVLTVPTTVVLDATGQAHAVNYGFANTKRLLEQVDAVLAKVAS
jgi:thioredoxin-like negative regulator of GroEL